MLRTVMVVSLLGMGLLVGPPAAPVARAGPETCPPTCDRIPSAAWPAPWSLPLYGTYRWPILSTLDRPAPGVRFRFEELCGTPRRPGDPRDYAVAAKRVIDQPAGQWQLQAQIVHWRGETWRGGELALDVFDAAAEALLACQRGNPAYSPSITTHTSTRLAAVISGPQVVHWYLLADPASSTLSELALWTGAVPGDEPAVAWPVVPDAEVFDALAAPLCGAYLGSCG